MSQSAVMTSEQQTGQSDSTMNVALVTSGKHIQTFQKLTEYEQIQNKRI